MAPKLTRVQLMKQLERANKELWLILSMFAIAALLNFALASQAVILEFYMLPTLGAGYLYGRREGTLTAVGSILIVILLMRVNPTLFSAEAAQSLPGGAWVDVTVWGGVLILCGYMMGTLVEHKNAQLNELRDTYEGILVILRHFISKDPYTENHSYRVSIYAAKIAARLGFGADRIQDVRAAALLHDVGKLEVSRQILYKAARLTEAEFEQMKQHVDKGVAFLQPVGGTLRRVLPIILAHHDRMDGSGYHGMKGGEIPIEARILAVADVWDSLTSDRPYRRAMPPLDAKEMIVKGRGTEYDEKVIDAFVNAMDSNEMEVPAVMV